MNDQLAGNCCIQRINGLLAGAERHHRHDGQADGQGQQECDGSSWPCASFAGAFAGAHRLPCPCSGRGGSRELGRFWCRSFRVNDELDRHDLTDEEWDRLAPLLPVHPRQGLRWNDHQVVISGILIRTRTVCPGRDLPSGTGIVRPSTRGIATGRWTETWEQVLDALRAGCDEAEGANCHARLLLHQTRETIC
jgi:transposase